MKLSALYNNTNPHFTTSNLYSRGVRGNFFLFTPRNRLTSEPFGAEKAVEARKSESTPRFFQKAGRGELVLQIYLLFRSFQAGFRRKLGRQIRNFFSDAPEDQLFI